MFSLTRARRLLLGKHRRTDGLFLAEGPHVVREALEAGSAPLAVFVSKDVVGDHEISELCVRSRDEGAWVEHIEARALAEIADTTTPQGLVAVVPIRACEEPDLAAGGLWLLLDGVQDPGNVGTLLRAAEAFGARGVLVRKGTADPWSGKVVRSAQGAHFRLDLWSEQLAATDLDALLTRLVDDGGAVWAATRDGEDLYGVAPPVSTCVVAVGNEARGLSAEILDIAARRIAVPQRGRADSLNVAMAASVVLSWLTRDPTA